MGNCLRSSNVVNPIVRKQGNEAAKLPTGQNDTLSDSSSSSRMSILSENPPATKTGAAGEKKPMSKIAMMKAEMKKKQKAQSAQSGNQELFDYLYAISQEPVNCNVDMAQIQERLSDQALVQAVAIQRDIMGLTIIDHLLINEKVSVFGMIIEYLDLANASEDFIEQISQITFKAKISCSKQFNRNPLPLFTFIDLIEKSQNLAILFSAYLINSKNLANFLQFIDLSTKASHELVSRITNLIEQSIAQKEDPREVELLQSILMIQKNIKFDQYFSNFKLPEDNAEVEKDIELGLLSFDFPKYEFNMSESKVQLKKRNTTGQTQSAYTLAHHLALNQKFLLFTGRWQIFKSQLFTADCNSVTPAEVLLRTAPLPTIEEFLEFCLSQLENTSKSFQSLRNSRKQNYIHFLIDNKNLSADDIPRIVNQITKNDASLKEELCIAFDTLYQIPLSYYLSQSHRTKSLSEQLLRFLTPSTLETTSSAQQRDTWLSGNAYPLWEFQFLANMSIPYYIFALHDKLRTFYERILGLNNVLFESISKQELSSMKLLDPIVQHLNLALIPNGLEKCVRLSNQAWIQKCVDDQLLLDEQRFNVLTAQVVSSGAESIRGALKFFVDIMETAKAQAHLIEYEKKNTWFRNQPKYKKNTGSLDRAFIQVYRYEKRALLRVVEPKDVSFAQPASALDSLVTVALREKKKEITLNSADAQLIEQNLQRVLSKLQSTIETNKQAGKAMLGLKSSLRVFSTQMNADFHTICKVYALGNAKVLLSFKQAIEGANLELGSVLLEKDVRRQVVLLNVTSPDLTKYALFRSPVEKLTNLDSLELEQALRQNYLLLGSSEVPAFILNHLSFFKVLKNMSVAAKKSLMTDMNLQLIGEKENLRELIKSEKFDFFNTRILEFLSNNFIGIVSEFGLEFVADYLRQLKKRSQFNILSRILLAVPILKTETQSLFRDIAYANERNAAAAAAAAPEAEAAEVSADIHQFAVNLSRRYEMSYYVQNSERIVESLLGCDLFGFKAFKIILPPLKFEVVRRLAADLKAHSSIHVQFVGDLILKTASPIKLLLSNSNYAGILLKIDWNQIPKTKAKLISDVHLCVARLNPKVLRKILESTTEDEISADKLKFEECSPSLLSVRDKKEKDKPLNETQLAEVQARAEIFEIIFKRFGEQYCQQLYEYFGAFVDPKVISSNPEYFSKDYTIFLSTLKCIYKKGGPLSRRRTQMDFAPFSDELLDVTILQICKEIETLLFEDNEAILKNPELKLNENNRFLKGKPPVAEGDEEHESEYRSVINDIAFLDRFIKIVVASKPIQESITRIIILAIAVQDDQIINAFIPLLKSMVKEKCPSILKIIDEGIYPYFLERVRHPEGSESTTHLGELENDITRLMEAASRFSNEDAAIHILTVSSLLYYNSSKYISNTTIGVRFGQPKPDPFDAIKKTFENYKDIPLSRFLSDKQFEQAMNVISSICKGDAKYIEEKQMKIFVNEIVEDIAASGSLNKWKTLFAHKEITENRVDSNVIFAAISKSLVSMLIEHPRKSTKQEAFFYTKYTDQILKSVINVNKRKSAEQSAWALATKEEYAWIQADCISKLKKFEKENKLPPIYDSYKEVGEDENGDQTKKEQIEQLVIEVIRASLLSEFEIALELAKCLIASKQVLEQKEKERLTYGVLIFGPMNNFVSLWSLDQFNAYMKVFTPMYLELIAENVPEENDESLQVGPLVALESCVNEINCAYLSFLLANRTALVPGFNKVLHFMLYNAIQLPAKNSKKHLLAAMQELGMTFHTKILTKTYQYREQFYENYTRQFQNKDTSEKEADDDNEVRCFAGDYIRYLSDEDLTLALSMKLFDFDQSVQLNRAMLLKKDFLRGVKAMQAKNKDGSDMKPYLQGKVCIARHLVLTGRSTFVKSNVEAILKAISVHEGSNRKEVLKSCARDALYANKLDLFEFFLQELSAKEGVKKTAFILEDRTLFELVKHFLGNNAVFMYLFKQFYCVSGLETELNVEAITQNNCELLQNLIIMQEENAVTEIFAHLLSKSRKPAELTQKEKAELRSALIRLPPVEPKEEKVEAEPEEGKEDEEAAIKKANRMSIADYLYEYRFYEALSLLLESGMESMEPSSDEVQSRIEEKLVSRYHNTKSESINLTRCELFVHTFRVFEHVRDSMTEFATSLASFAKLEQVMFFFWRSTAAHRRNMTSLFEDFVQKQFLGGIYSLAELFPQIDVTELIFKNNKLQRSEMFNIYLLKRTVYPDLDFIALNMNKKLSEQLEVPTPQQQQQHQGKQLTPGHPNKAQAAGHHSSGCSMTTFMVTLAEKKLLNSMRVIKLHSKEIDTSKLYSQDSKEAVLKEFLMKAYYMKLFIKIIGERDRHLLLNDDEILENIILQDPKIAIDLLKSEDVDSRNSVLDRFRNQIKQNQVDFVDKDAAPTSAAILNDSPFNKVLRAILYYFDVRNDASTISDVYSNIFSDIAAQTKQGISFQYHLTITKASVMDAGAAADGESAHAMEANINESSITELVENLILPHLFDADTNVASANPKIEFTTFFEDLAALALKSPQRSYSIVFENVFIVLQTLYSLRLLDEGNEDKALSIRLRRGEVVPCVSEISETEVCVALSYSMDAESSRIEVHCSDLSFVLNEINSFYFVHKYLPQIMQQLETFNQQKNNLIPPSQLGKISLEFDYASIDHLPLEYKQLILSQTNFVPISVPRGKSKKSALFASTTTAVYDSNLYFGLYSLFQEIATNISFLNENQGEFYSINDMFAPNNSATMNPADHPHLNPIHSHQSNLNESEAIPRLEAKNSQQQQQQQQYQQSKVLDKVKMQGAIIQYYLEQLPDNTYKLRPRKKMVMQNAANNHREELFFSEFYKFTPLQEGTMEIVYIPPEEFAARTTPSAIFDSTLSQLLAYEQNFIESLRQSALFQMDEEEINLDRSSHKWFYTIKPGVPTSDPEQSTKGANKVGANEKEKAKLESSPEKGKETKSISAPRVVWSNELFVGYNILHIKQMLRYFQREVEFGKPTSDSLNLNWKINSVSLFEVLLSGMTRIARASSRSVCDEFGLNPDSIFGILKHILSSPILFKLIREILFNNFANAGNIIKVIKGFYFEFSEIEPSELPSACSDTELTSLLSQAFDKIVRFGRTEYYIHKHMLVIRLNLAFIANSIDGLSKEVAKKSEESVATADNTSGTKAPKRERKINAGESETIKNYILTVANAFDFYEQLFSPEQIVCQILNKLEIDNHMLAVSKEISTMHSQSIMININYESLFALFKSEISCAKLIVDPLKQISKYESVWKGLENIRNYFMNDFYRIITRQLEKQSFQDLFSMIFINLVYAFENKQRISKRLFSNYRSHAVLVPALSDPAADAGKESKNGYLAVDQRNSVGENNQDDIDDDDNDEFQSNNLENSSKLIETLLQLDGSCSKFENTFLIQMNLSDFIQQVQPGDDIFIGYSNNNSNYCNKFGTVSKKSNLSITFGTSYQTMDSVNEIQFDKMNFVMKNFKKWPNPAIFKADIIRYGIIDSALKIRLVHSRAIQDICNFYMRDSTEKDPLQEEEYEGYLYRGGETISSEISLSNLIQMMPNQISLYFQMEDKGNAASIFAQGPSLELTKQKSTLPSGHHMNEQSVVFKLNEAFKFKAPEIYPAKLSFASQIDSNIMIYEEQLGLIGYLQKLLRSYLYGEKCDSLKMEFEYDSAFEESRYQYLDMFTKNISLITENISDAFLQFVEGAHVSEEILKSIPMLACDHIEERVFSNEMHALRFLVVKLLLKHVEVIQLKFSDFPQEFSSKTPKDFEFVTYQSELKTIYIHVFVGKTDAEILIPSVQDIRSSLSKQIVLCELEYLRSAQYNNKSEYLPKQGEITPYVVNQSLKHYQMSVKVDLKQFNQLEPINYERLLHNLAMFEFTMKEIVIDSTLANNVRASRFEVELHANASKTLVVRVAESNTISISLGGFSERKSTILDGISAAESKSECWNYFLPYSYIRLSDLVGEGMIKTPTEMENEAKSITLNQQIRQFSMSDADSKVFTEVSSYEVRFLELSREMSKVHCERVSEVEISGNQVQLRVNQPIIMKGAADHVKRLKYVILYKGEIISSNFTVNPGNSDIEGIRAQLSDLKALIHTPVSFVVQASNPTGSSTIAGDLDMNVQTKYEGVNASLVIDLEDISFSLRTYANRYQEFINNNKSLRFVKASLDKKKKNLVSSKVVLQITSRYLTKDTILVTVVNPKAEHIQLKNSDTSKIFYSGATSSLVDLDQSTSLVFFTKSKISIDKTLLIGSKIEGKAIQNFNTKKAMKNPWLEQDLALKRVFAILTDFSYIEDEKSLKGISDLQNQIKSQEGQHVFFSRAGEERVEILHFNDGYSNMIELSEEQLHSFTVQFSHSVFPSIVFRGTLSKSENGSYAIKWRPLVKGAYKLFVNSCYVPQSEDHIGVIANVVDVTSIRVVHKLPTTIPFYEQVECQIYLKDKYSNIYSEFDRSRAKDTSVISVKETNLKPETKFIVKHSHINKDGKQSILISFESDSAGQVVDGQVLGDQKAIIEIGYETTLLEKLTIQVAGLNFEKRKRVFYESLAKYKKNHLSVTIEINRDRFAEELLANFEKLDLKSSIYVVFKGERGVDGGGLKREFYELVGKMIKDSNYKFFEIIRSSSNEKLFFHPQCLKSKQSLAYFTIFGKFLAHSILHQSLLGIDFCEPFFKLLAKYYIEFSDLKQIIDQPTYDNYCYLKTLDDESLADMCQFFQVTVGNKQENLIPNGDKKQVDKTNLKEFLDLTAKYYIEDRYKPAVTSLIEGFESVFPVDCLMKAIRPHEIAFLTCGVKQITGILLQKLTRFQGGTSLQINFFHRYLLESEPEMLSNFLKFISGSSSIPYEHSNTVLTIQFITSMGTNLLPISHTCFLSIEVPYYKTYEQMKNKFDLAFSLGNEGFAFG